MRVGAKPWLASRRVLQLQFCLSVRRSAVAAFAQAAALDLAQEVLGKLADDLNLPGALLLAQVLLAMGVKRRLIQRYTGPGHDNSNDVLAALRVRHPDDGRLGDAGELVQDLFHLGREDEEPRGLDDVLLAVDNREVTVPIAAGQVAGVEPAAAQGAGRLFRVVE